MLEVSELRAQTAKFVARMAAAFGAPDTADGGEFKRLLDERIGGYDEATLTAVADHFIENRKSWPKIADIIASAKNQAAKAETERRRGEAMQSVERDPWKPEALAEADRLICRDMGRRAAVEGWIGQLWDFCRNHGRLPHEGREAKRVQDSAQGHERKREFVKRGGIKDERVSAALKRMAVAMEEHDERLCRMAKEQGDG